MTYQRITLDPLARITRPTSRHDGRRWIWDDEIHGPPPPGYLPDGEAYVPILPRPVAGEDYDKKTQRIEQHLTTEADGWQVIDLTAEEIAARNAPTVGQTISALGAEFKARLPAAYHGQFAPIFATVRVLLEAGEPALAQQAILATPVPPELEETRAAMAALITDPTAATL